MTKAEGDHLGTGNHPGASHVYDAQERASASAEPSAVEGLLRRLNAWFLHSAPEHYRGCGLHVDVEAALRRLEPCEPEDEGPDGWTDWIHPLPGYRLQCCDCGLIHDMEFAIGATIDKGGPFNDGEGEDHVVIFRARRAAGQPRNEAATPAQVSPGMPPTLPVDGG